MFHSKTTNQNTDRTRTILARLVAVMLLVAGIGLVAGPALSAPGDPDPFGPDPLGPDFDIFEPEPDLLDPSPEIELPDLGVPELPDIPEFPELDFGSHSDVGNLVEFEAHTKALAADVNKNFSDVKESLNAKTAGGIDFVRSEDNVDVLPNTTIASLTVDIPYTGHVKVDFSAQLEIDHNAPFADKVSCAIKTAETSPLLSANRLTGTLRTATIMSGQADGLYMPSIQTTGVYSATFPGEVTFYAQCSSLHDVGVVAHTLVAIFQEDRL